MTALTMKEAAAELRVSRRQLQRIIARFPFFYSNGRIKLFTAADIERIREGLRNEGSRSPTARTRTIGTSLEPSPERALQKVRELLAKKRRKTPTLKQRQNRSG